VIDAVAMVLLVPAEQKKESPQQKVVGEGFFAAAVACHFPV